LADVLGGVVVVVLIAGACLAVGLGFGIVIAPRIGRALDRMDTDAEEPVDRPD